MKAAQAVQELMVVPLGVGDWIFRVVVQSIACNAVDRLRGLLQVRD